MAGKADILDKVANGVEGVTKKQAGEVLDIIFDSITDYLVDGERVQIPGFGNFSPSHRDERQGRNPATGETITIAASTNARFKPAKQLKDRLNA